MSFERRTIAHRTIDNFSVIVQEYVFRYGTSREVQYGASVIDNAEGRTVYSISEMPHDLLSGDVIGNVLDLSRKAGVEI